MAGSPVGPLQIPTSSTIGFREPRATTQVEQQVAFAALNNVRAFEEQSKVHSDVPSEDELRVLRGGQGVDYVVKKHEVAEEGSTLKAIAKLAAKTIFTGGLALLHPGTYHAFQADRKGTRKNVEYSTDISEPERARMDEQLLAYYTMKVGNQNYDVRKLEDRAKFAKAEFDANPDRFTHVRGKGHYYIDQQHSRIIIVPDGNNGRPDFSKTQSYHATDLKDVAIKDRLQLERTAFQTLHAQDEIARGLQAGIDKKLSILLTDESLKQFRREMVARMLRLLGAASTLEILRAQLGVANLSQKEQALLNEDLTWVEQQRDAIQEKPGKITVDEFTIGRLGVRETELQACLIQQNDLGDCPDPSADADGAAIWNQKNEELNQEIQTLRDLIRTDMKKARSVVQQLFSTSFPQDPGTQTPTLPADLETAQCRYASTVRPEGVDYVPFKTYDQAEAKNWYWKAMGQRHLDGLRASWLARYENEKVTEREAQEIHAVDGALQELSKILATSNDPVISQQIATLASQAIGLQKQLAVLPDTSPEKASLRVCFIEVGGILAGRGPLSVDHIKALIEALYDRYRGFGNPSEEQSRILAALKPPEGYSPIDGGNGQWLIPGEARSYQVASTIGALDWSLGYAAQLKDRSYEIAGRQVCIRELQQRLAQAGSTEEKTEVELQIGALQQEIQERRARLKLAQEDLQGQIAQFKPLLEAAKQEGILLQDYALAKKKLAAAGIGEKEQILGQAYTALNGLVRLGEMPDVLEREDIRQGTVTNWKSRMLQGLVADHARFKTIEELHIEQQKVIRGLNQGSFKTLIINSEKKNLRVGNEDLVYNPESKKMERSVDFSDSNAGISIKATDSFWTQVELSYKDKFSEQIEKPELRKAREASARTPTTLQLDEEEAKKSPLGDIVDMVKGGFSKLLGFDD